MAGSRAVPPRRHQSRSSEAGEAVMTDLMGTGVNG